MAVIPLASGRISRRTRSRLSRFMPHQFAPTSEALHLARGWSTASAPSTKYARLSSRSAARRSQRQASFLPGVYQGCNVNYNSKMDLDDVSHEHQEPVHAAGSPAPRTRSGPYQAERHPCQETLQFDAQLRRASSPSRWRSRCRPRRPTPSTSPRNRTPRVRPMASTRKSGPSSSSPAALGWSAGCASIQVDLRRKLGSPWRSSPCALKEQGWRSRQARPRR